jgi:very-short-patch-repair endonuclease
MDDHRSSLFNARKKKQDRRILRKSSTAAEAVLWTYLQNRKLLGKKFRRQSSVGPYIVDFYCPECRLVTELDGAPHFAPNVDEYDQQRTEYLEQAGLQVIRFENKDVRDNVEFVLETIKRGLQPN